MNLEARINLQKGIPENKMNEWTNYNIESPLDAYIVQKQQIRNKYYEQRREEQQQAALEEYVSKMLDDKLEESLEKILGDLLKSFK